MENNVQTQELTNSETLSYADTLRETQQEVFPLLSEVTTPFVENPLTLMNSICDKDGVVVPCALPDSMTQCLPQTMGEFISNLEDGLSTRFLYHNLPAKNRVRGEMDEATAEAIRIGETMGIKENAVAKKLTKLTSDYYIGKVRQGVFVKTTKTERDKWKNKITPLAA